jgi:hypothetical protein
MTTLFAGYLGKTDAIAEESYHMLCMREWARGYSILQLVDSLMFDLRIHTNGTAFSCT